MSATPTDVDTPTDGRPLEVLDSPLEELSPTEVHLESLRRKLETQQSTAEGKIEEAETQLSNARTRINNLKEKISGLETATLDARDAMNQAMGLAYALQKTVKELRHEETGEREGGGVGELRMLVEAEEQRARELAVTLIGDSPYTDEFLTNTTIDEGRAGGLVFEIKNDYRKRVDEKRAAITQALQARVPRSHPEYEKRERAYQEAEDHYRNASSDLANAEYRLNSLLEQVKHSLSTIAALNEAVAKADRVAVRIEEQGKRHELEDLSKASDSFDKQTAATMRAKAELTEAEQNEKTLEELLAEWIKKEERVKESMRKVSDLPLLVTLAVEHSTKAPHMLGRRLLAVKSDLASVIAEATAHFDPAVVQIAPLLHGKISYAVGHGIGSANSAFVALEKAMERLQELLKRLEDDVAMADMEEADSIDWVAMERMLQCGEELDQFLKNEWQRLSVGTPEGVFEIVNRARSDVEKALEPLAVLRRREAAPAESSSAVEADAAVEAAEAEAGRIEATDALRTALATEKPVAAEEEKEKDGATETDLPRDLTGLHKIPVSTPPVAAATEPTPTSPQTSHPSPRRKRGIVEE